MSRNTGSVASSDKSWLKLYAAVAVLPLALAACGGGGGGGGSPTPPLTPPPSPSPAPTPAPTPAPAPTIGTTWNNVTAASVGNLTGVDYDNGHFVAVSDTGAALTSTDGATWTAVTPLTSGTATDHLKATVVGHLGATFVAAGSVSPAPYTSSAGALATSSDGSTWTMASLPAGTTPIHGLIAGTILIGLGEAGHLYSSSDGATWSAEKAINGLPTMNAGVYGAGAYLAVGDNGYMIRSVDGLANWGVGQVITVGGAGVNLHGVAWNGTKFVAVGDNGAIATSSNGTAWSSPLKVSAISGALRGVAAASNGTFVVVGDNGIETSTDNGDTWIAQNGSGVAALSGVTFGNSEFVAVGAASAIKTSSN
jgi:hypothetical protein